MLKMAVFGPIPSASAAMTARENLGALLSIRAATRRSDQKPLMMILREAEPHSASRGPLGCDPGVHGRSGRPAWPTFDSGTRASQGRTGKWRPRVLPLPVAVREPQAGRDLGRQPS